MGGQIPIKKHYRSFQMIVRELSFLLEWGHLFGIMIFLVAPFACVKIVPPLSMGKNIGFL